MIRQRHTAASPVTEALVKRLTVTLPDGTAPATRVYNALTLIAREPAQYGHVFESVADVRAYARSVLSAAGMEED